MAHRTRLQHTLGRHRTPRGTPQDTAGQRRTAQDTASTVGSKDLGGLHQVLQHYSGSGIFGHHLHLACTLHPPTRLSIHPSNHPSIHLSFHPSTHLAPSPALNRKIYNYKQERQCPLTTQRGFHRKGTTTKPIPSRPGGIRVPLPPRGSAGGRTVDIP